MPQENQAASKVRVEMSQNDTLKRDMTHQAPIANPSTGHGFHQGTNLHTTDRTHGLL